MNHLPPPFEACSLDEPFIFVSYSHKDTALVFPELEALHKHGYRIWYDDGIHPGKEWPEEISGALAASAFFIVFISPNAVESVNVRNEINFALARRKPFLAVHLSETKLPDGLELQIGSLQAILKYRMNSDSYQRKVIKVLPDELVIEEGLDVAEEAEKPSSPIIQIPSIILPKPNDPNTVTDIDGNVYKTVKIGNQEWMAENLRVTRLNDGTPIEEVIDDEIWEKTRNAAFCWYLNDNTFKNKFGALYNFYVIETEILAPEGWRLPTEEDWQVLIKTTGDIGRSGRILKSKKGWRILDDNGFMHDIFESIDSLLFAAFPGGRRDEKGRFINMWAPLITHFIDSRFRFFV